MARKKLTLQDVAQAAVDRNGGKGGRALQREAEKHGLTLSFTTVDRILNGKYESRPQRQTIEALAQLSGLPLEKVYMAAGIPMPMAPLADQLPDGADQLSVDQRRVVLDVIRGFVRDNDRMAALERERDERPLPMRELLAWIRSHPRDELELLDLDELYDMSEIFRSALPSFDELEEAQMAAVAVDRVLRTYRSAFAKEEARNRASAPSSSGRVEGDAVADGVTPAAPGRVEYPWEQSDFDLAAKRGRNRGREARDQQDRDAEDGGA